nr:RecName: Full=Beta-lactamase [Streptomyces griseus]
AAAPDIPIANVNA